MTGRGEFHPAGTPSPRLTLFARRFEKLVRGPKPWYFGHILLPGGSANLRIPKYNLKDGPEATTLGTVMECLAVERRTDGCLVVVSQGVGRFRVRDVKRTLPHDVVDASWVLDKEEGDHEAWRAFEYGPGGVKLSSTSAEVAELSPLRLDRAPVQSGVVVEAMGEPVDDDTASDDVEQRVWDAVAVDGGLLEKILMADGTPAEQAKIRLPHSREHRSPFTEEKCALAIGSDACPMHES